MIKRVLRLLLAGTIIAPAGCVGANVSAAPAATTPASWVAALRFDPYDVVVSLSASVTPFVYVDSGAANGSYPSLSAFSAEFQAANPALTAGACSTIARITDSAIELTDASGVAAPSFIIFLQPKAVGSCTQSINVGAAGAQHFSVTVTP